MLAVTEIGTRPPFSLVCLTAQRHRPLWVQAGLGPPGMTGDRVFVSAATTPNSELTSDKGWASACLEGWGEAVLLPWGV